MLHEKKKYIRGNNKPFMAKELSKSIMERTRLRNKFLKIPTIENKLAYTKQRNFCVSLLRKVKREYFANINEKNIIDNRKFWQTVKASLSEKNKSKEKITLIKNDEIISDDLEIANTLNKFFSNVVKNLKIPEKFANNNLPRILSKHPTLNAIMKYKNHQSMDAIKKISHGLSRFYFSRIDKKTVLNEIKKLKLSKAVQDSDIPVKILKENSDFFAEYIYLQFNEAVDSSKFADFLSMQTLQQVLSKVYEIKQITTGLFVFCLSFQKFLKRLFAGSSQITLIIFYQNFNVVLEKDTTHNTASF